MLADLLKRLRRRNRARSAAPAATLPPSVERALGNLTATARPDHEGKARVLLMWAGDAPSAWHHSSAETRARFAAAFPDLDGDQLDRACRAAAGMVRAAQREAAPTREGRKWSASTWPVRGFTEV